MEFMKLVINETKFNHEDPQLRFNHRRSEQDVLDIPLGFWKNIEVKNEFEYEGRISMEQAPNKESD
jgi:hypothetical protein